MTVSTRRRRQAGEGGISEYTTKAGTRYRIDFTIPGSDGGTDRQTKGGFTTKKAAGKALRDAVQAVEGDRYVRGDRRTVDQHMVTWLDGLRLRPSTVAAYRRLHRLHVSPYIGSLPVQDVTASRLTRLYRQLESTGRRGQGSGDGLGMSTVRKVHHVLSGAFRAAVNDGLIARSPADRAKPPTAKEAAPPEMKVWSPAQCAALLDWAKRVRPEWHPMWLLLFTTGVRRGELCGMRWSDIDLAEGTVTVRRSVNVITGGGSRVFQIGPPKNGNARTIALDGGTVAVLRAWRLARAEVGLVLVRGDSYVFGDLAGGHRDPVAIAEAFTRHIRMARDAGATVELPTIRFHDVRHSHATALLLAGVPVQVAAERIGDDPGTMLRVYAHVLPGQQRQAAEAVAALLVTSSVT